MKNRLVKICCLILFIGLIGCSTDYKEANKIAVEKLKIKLLEGKFEELYNANIQAYMSKEEFVENMKFAVSTMKEFDESLAWQQDEIMDERRVHEASNYEETSWRTMKKDGRTLDITIWWSKSFTFCDLIVKEDAPDKPEIVVSRCSTS